MLPTIFSYGPFVLRTLTIFAVIASIGAAFLFWRKGREEHYDEMQIFDGFLLSSLVGLLGSRIAFVIFQFSEFSFSPLKWLNIFGYPGFNLSVGIVIAGLYLYSFAQKHKWDVFEILDFWVTAVSFGLAMLWLGIFFDGTGFGYATHLPWGVVFPGVFEKHQPVQLYFAIFYFLLCYYLAWSEYRYRTFSWYRAGKNTAQTGYVTSIFISATGFFSLILAFLRPGQFVIAGFTLDIFIYLSLCLFGIGLLINRSGRSIIPTPKRSPPF